MAFYTGVGLGNGFLGPVLGTGYSFNGKADIVAGFSSLTKSGDNITGYSFGANFFASRQNQKNNFVNVDLSPLVSFSLFEGDLQTTLAVGLGVSADISPDPDLYFIPGAEFSYGLQIEQNENIALLGLSLDMGFDLGNNLLFILTSGVSANLSQKGTTGTITAGLLLR